MNRQLIFEQHAHESNWHRCLMLDWEEDAVILRCPGEPHEIPGGDFGFPGDSIYSKWQGSRLSHEEVTALEKLLHFTRLPLDVPNLCLLDGADYRLSIRAGGQMIHLHWQNDGNPSPWSPLYKLADFLKSLYERHAGPS